MFTDYISESLLEAKYPDLTCRKGDKVRGIRTFNTERIQGIFQGYRNVSKKREYIVGVVYVEGDRCYDVFLSHLCKIED